MQIIRSVGITRTKRTAVYWQMDILHREMAVMYRTANCVTLWFLYVCRCEDKSEIDCCGYEQRLPWWWTEEAAPWISQQLGLLVSHIVGTVLCIALCCCCWQCLLTVGENWLPHTVTSLDVTIVAWCCRQTQNVLHLAECPPGALQISQWQWTTWHCTGRYSSLFTAENCLQYYLNACLNCWADITVKCVRCYCEWH